MELALLKALLSHEFYQNHKTVVRQEIFSDEANKIKRCLDKAHDEYERDLTESELEAVFYTSHPTLTTAQRSSYQKMFNEMRSENAIGEDMASNILRDLWRRAIADDLASHAMDMINGRVTSMMPLREMIETYEEDFMPSVRVVCENIDLDYIREQTELNFRWRINIPTLAELWPGVNDGQLIVGAARTNVGKTSAIAYLVSGPDGFVDQGARVLVLVNEEKASRIVSRNYCAATSLSIKEVFDESNSRYVQERVGKDSQWRNNFNIVDATGWDIDRMEAAIKNIKPDIVIADMADKFTMGGSYSAAHEALKALYIRFRIIGKQYGCAIFGMSQMSAEAEGRVMVNSSMLEGSKTGKAAEADLLFCLTMNPMVEGAQDDNERHWVIVKNKLTGRHGMVHTMLDPNTATFSV